MPMPKDPSERADDAEAVISALHDMDNGLMVSFWELSPDGPHVSRLELTVEIYHNKVDFQTGDDDE